MHMNAAKGSLSIVNGARRGTKKVNEMLSSARLENVPDLNELLKYGNEKEVSKWIEAATATGHHNLIGKLASASQGNARAIDEAFSEIISQSPKSLGSLLYASTKIFIKAASEGKSDLVNAFLRNIKYDVNNPDTSNALIAFSPTLSRAAKAANKNGRPEITKSIYYQLALNSRSKSPIQLEPIILKLDENTQQKLLLDAAAQNHFSLLKAFSNMKKGYLDYNKAIAAAVMHGNFDMVSRAFKPAQAADAYYQLALNSKTLTKETYIKLILSLSHTQQENLFYQSAQNGNIQLLDAFTASKVVDLDYMGWIDIAAKKKLWDPIIQHFLPSDINKEVIRPSTDTKRQSMVRTILQKTMRTEKQERLRFLIFKDAAERGDIGVINIFFKNPKSLDLHWQYPSIAEYFTSKDLNVKFRNIDSRLLMILNGILLASFKSQGKMIKFLMGKVDVAAENNLLLNVAADNGDKKLVKILLQNDRVIQVGLDQAMTVTKSDAIFNLLYQKSIITSE